MALNVLTGEAQPIRDSEMLWLRAGQPCNTRISAVLTLEQLSWSSTTSVGPTLWLNQWAARPLAVGLPFRTVRVGEDGVPQTQEASTSSAALFQRPPGRPFVT